MAVHMSVLVWAKPGQNGLLYAMGPSWYLWQGHKIVLRRRSWHLFPICPHNEYSWLFAIWWKWVGMGSNLFERTIERISFIDNVFILDTIDLCAISVGRLLSLFIYDRHFFIRRTHPRRKWVSKLLIWFRMRNREHFLIHYHSNVTSLVEHLNDGWLFHALGVCLITGLWWNAFWNGIR